MTPQPSDLELLQRVAVADREAFRLFYDRHAPQVLAYVRSLGRSRDASEDVVQEVFLAVWRKAGTYRPERGDVAGWLYTMTRNKVVDLWRKLPTGSDQSTEESLAALSERPEAESRVVSISLRKAMADLKLEQRQALELAYFGGLTYEETAERLKLPVGTLKSRIRAGLALMRGVLSESGSSSL
ncbi:MAG: sigma-70 family RNA polymerase sigma factor [Thermoanaerobaculia bacterium]|jgi:RNA polymerase sigma-70 factor (ECF subfamily)|nr:sigma-70 family RNA polymerase sigma factor [Thermoanaerobaculia bacterium]MBP9823242.1 sigma-70 family RNA polymerase sigma factor [Thermoanaerobaculia bacterium]